MSGVAWLLNLDAEEELAALRAGRVHRPRACSAAERLALEELGARLGSGRNVLLGSAPGERGAPSAGAAAGLVGRAWMPTPSALAELSRAGARVPDAPDVRTLVLANARETFRDLARLPGGVTVDTADGLVRALGAAAPGRAPGSGRAPGWLVRPSLVAAGRARLVLDAGAVSQDPAAVERACAYAERHLSAGSLDVAPLVDVEAEFALHGWLERDGRLRIGAPVLNACRGGVWRAARKAEGCPFEGELRSALEAVAERLVELGYFGPFGIDALVWIDAKGARHLHAPLEVNARYSMAYPQDLEPRLD